MLLANISNPTPFDHPVADIAIWLVLIGLCAACTIMGLMQMTVAGDVKYARIRGEYDVRSYGWEITKAVWLLLTPIIFVFEVLDIVSSRALSFILSPIAAEARELWNSRGLDELPHQELLASIAYLLFMVGITWVFVISMVNQDIKLQRDVPARLNRRS